MLSNSKARQVIVTVQGDVEAEAPAAVIKEHTLLTVVVNVDVNFVLHSSNEKVRITTSPPNEQDQDRCHRWTVENQHSGTHERIIF